MEGENDQHQPEEYLMGMIRGEHLYVPQEGADREDPGVVVREGAGREGAGEDEREEDVSSFLNPFGDGMEIETFDDEWQINTDGKQQLKQTPMARYIDLAFGHTKGICIYVLTTIYFFSHPDRANRILNKVQAKS
jgi:hypothetical protein